MKPKIECRKTTILGLGNLTPARFLKKIAQPKPGLNRSSTGLLHLLKPKKRSRSAVGGTAPKQL
jgi:hypothetical protein